MEAKVKAAKDARNLLLNEYHGILSTHSDNVPGYPFGSVMPYCLDGNGNPIILISDIAQHTKNIEKNPKVSLVVTQSCVDDVHKAGRLTWIGDAEKIDNNSDEIKDIQQRYYSFFPPSEHYHKIHGFDFFRINLVRARYIGGFGQAFWVKSELLTKANPFYGNAEQGMIQHMNEDHIEAMVKYCKMADVMIPENVQPKMAGIDSDGMHILLKDRLVRIAFPDSVEEPSSVRKTLVDMARAA